MTRSVFSGNSVILSGLPAVSAQRNLKMFFFVLRRKKSQYISLTSLLSFSPRDFSELDASFKRPFSMDSAYFRMNVEKGPNSFGWTKSNTDHNSLRLFCRGVPDRASRIPLHLNATRFLLSSVLMFLARCPSSTTTKSYLTSLRLILSEVIIPQLVTRIPPFLLIIFIWSSRFYFFLSSNCIIFSTFGHHLASSVSQYTFIVAGTAMSTFLICSESNRPLHRTATWTVLPSPMSSPSTPPFRFLNCLQSHFTPVF